MLALTVPLLIFHLLCVNLAAAGPLLCIAYEWCEQRGSESAGRVGRRLSKASLLALILGLLSGLLVGWLRWRPELSVAWTLLQRKIFFGALEILFSMGLIAWHITWWRDTNSRGRRARCFVLLLAGANLLYHFPTLFAVVSHLEWTGQLSSPEDVTTLSAAAFRKLLTNSDVLAQACHVIMACFAVASAWVFFQARAEPLSARCEAIRPAAIISLAATALQLPIGIAFTVAYPRAGQRQLMGGDAMASAAFVLSILATLPLLQYLGTLAIGAPADDAATRLHESARRRATWLTVAIVALMSVAMARSRV